MGNLQGPAVLGMSVGAFIGACCQFKNGEANIPTMLPHNIFTTYNPVTRNFLAHIGKELRHTWVAGGRVIVVLRFGRFFP